MRKFAVIGATLVLLVGTTTTLSGASPASQNGSSQNAAKSRTKVLHLISHQTSLKVIDLGAKGNSPGDQIIETTVDFQNGKRIDRSVLNCVEIAATATGVDALCHGALVLEDGQIEAQGQTDFHTPFTVAITGGTGAYQNIGGQVTVERTLPNGIDDVETVRLIFLETE